MNFFTFREQWKQNPTQIVFGQDAPNLQNKAGRDFLRRLYLQKDPEAAALETASGIRPDYSVSYHMYGRDPGAVGMETVHVPSPAEVRDTFYKNGKENVHPRLLADADRFAFLQAHRDEYPYKNWLDAMKERAETMLSSPFAPWVDAGDEEMAKKNYLGPCRTVKVLVQTLSMLYRVTGDHRYLDRTKAEMLNFITYPTYYPEHYLNVAEACYALCMGYDWLYDEFTEEERLAIRTAVKEKCFDTAYELMRDITGWAGVLNNWNQVCNGGIAMGAMVLFEHWPELCSELISFAVRNMPRSLGDISPDGCYPEGPTYWDYGTAYSTYFMAALNSVLGSDYGLSNCPGYAESMAYVMYCSSSTGDLATYADAAVLERGMPQAYWMANRYNEPAYTTYTLQAWPRGGITECGAYELLWYKEQPTITPEQASFPPDMLFGGHESIAFFRENWTSSDAMYVFFKGGDNQANHGCLDIGEVLLDRFGVRWLSDLRSESYAVPGYWDKVEGRWQYYRKRAEGHNTLLVNPGKGADQDVFAACAIDSFGTAPQKAFALCDLAEAYAPFGADRVRRGVLVHHDRTALLVQDEISCKTASTVHWRMHTTVEDVTVSGNVATLKAGGHTLTITMEAPGAAFTLLPAARLLPDDTIADSPNPAAKVLSVVFTDVKELTLRARFAFDGDDTVLPPMRLDDFADFVQG